MNKYITPGTRIGVLIFGFIRHEGITTDSWIDGEQCVISRSRRAKFAVEEPLSKFAAGGKIVILEPLSKLHPTQVVRNARRLLNTVWRLLDANCEHFVYECFGLKPQSPQLQALTAVIGLTALALISAR